MPKESDVILWAVIQVTALLIWLVYTHPAFTACIMALLITLRHHFHPQDEHDWVMLMFIMYVRELIYTSWWFVIPVLTNMYWLTYPTTTDDVCKFIKNIIFIVMTAIIWCTMYVWTRLYGAYLEWRRYNTDITIFLIPVHLTTLLLFIVVPNWMAAVVLGVSFGLIGASALIDDTSDDNDDDHDNDGDSGYQAK